VTTSSNYCNLCEIWGPHGSECLLGCYAVQSARRLPPFSRCCSRHYLLIVLMTEAASTSETSVNFYHITRQNNTEESSSVELYVCQGATPCGLVCTGRKKHTKVLMAASMRIHGATTQKTAIFKERMSLPSAMKVEAACSSEIFDIYLQIYSVNTQMIKTCSPPQEPHSPCKLRHWKSYFGVIRTVLAWSEIQANCGLLIFKTNCYEVINLHKISVLYLEIYIKERNITRYDLSWR
jgi:hypothetical protein